MDNDFKINVYFNDEGKEIEKLLAFYLKNLCQRGRGILTQYVM